jgi:hypothetical protein
MAMSKCKPKTLIVLVMVLISIILIAGSYFHFGFIGPGLPDSINGWYFPEPDGFYNNGTRMFTGTGTEHFGRIGGISSTCPLMFPNISDECIGGQYERFYPDLSPMDDKYVAISWSFNRTEDFENAEKILYQSLEESGNISVMILDIGPELRRRSAIGDNETQYGFNKVPVTQYISNKTSGYFMEFRRPLLQDREDYMIVYYGVLDSNDMSAHSRFLTVLMVQGGFPPYDRISRLMDTLPTENVSKNLP